MSKEEEKKRKNRWKRYVALQQLFENRLSAKEEDAFIVKNSENRKTYLTCATRNQSMEVSSACVVKIH